MYSARETISMARTEPGTASTEFFICIGNQTEYDSGGSATPDKLGMAAFGKVIRGMKVVRKIQNESSKGDRLINPVSINNISRF